VRLESLSYMSGLAVAMAAATVVGQSLGMRDPRRASRAAHLAYLIGGGGMSFVGICFILFRHQLAHLLSNDPRIMNLTATCLLITAFAQPGFACSLVYAGALRGAGDTFVVMIVNLASIICLRLASVVVVTLGLGYGLPAVWMVLAIELTLRGTFVLGRFLHGGWKHVEV
jgi:Na+-driven multidrug efflux pump